VFSKVGTLAFTLVLASVLGDLTVGGAAETSVGRYASYGVSDQDVVEYRIAGASLSACSAAHRSNPDPFHPVDYTQRLMHVASLYDECGKSLRKHHASAGVLHTNGVFLGFTCSALSASTGTAVTVPAC